MVEGCCAAEAGMLWESVAGDCVCAQTGIAIADASAKTATWRGNEKRLELCIAAPFEFPMAGTCHEFSAFAYSP